MDLKRCDFVVKLRSGGQGKVNDFAAQLISVTLEPMLVGRTALLRVVAPDLPGRHLWHPLGHRQGGVNFSAACKGSGARPVVERSPIY